MSPSWRDMLQVTLGAQSLRAQSFARGWRPREGAQVLVPLGAGDAAAALPPTAEAAAQALATALHALREQGVRLQGAQAHMRVSGDWVRFALQDGSAALRGRAERHAAATHALRRVYGDEAAAWQVAECEAGPGMLLAAGIDAGLTAQLSAVLQAAGATLASVQPLFAQAVNRCRPALRGPGWLLNVEPALATLAWYDGRALRSLRTHRRQRELAQELPQWLDQARLIDGLAEADAPLTVAHDAEALPALGPLQARARLVPISAMHGAREGG